MGDQFPDDDADHRFSWSARDNRSIGKDDRDARISGRPHGARTYENAAVLVGDSGGKVDRITDREGGIDYRANPDPRRTEVSDRLVGFRLTNHAVRIEGRENRDERSPRGGSDRYDFSGMLEPDCFLGYCDRLRHCIMDGIRLSSVTFFLRGFAFFLGQVR
jgi:hypothetical protein